MSEYGQFSYDVDLCLVIDKTGSMSPIIDTVKTNALNLYHDITRSLEEKGKHIRSFRVRVIWFGDYKADKVPIIVSPFLNLPEDNDKFNSFVKDVKAEGGGDSPEDGLEALAYAIRSDWCDESVKKRHIVALFTDAPAHELGFGKTEPTYPREYMPGNFGELSAMWGDEDDPGEMDFHAKRLLLFAPDEGAWHSIANGWEQTVMRTVKGDTGLSDVTYQTMLNAISNSI